MGSRSSKSLNQSMFTSMMRSAKKTRENPFDITVDELLKAQNMPLNKDALDVL